MVHNQDAAKTNLHSFRTPTGIALQSGRSKNKGTYNEARNKVEKPLWETVRARGNDLEEWETEKEESLDIACNCMDHQSFNTRKWQRGCRETKTNKGGRGSLQKDTQYQGTEEKIALQKQKKNQVRRDSFKGQLSPVFPLKTIKDGIYFFKLDSMREKWSPTRYKITSYSICHYNLTGISHQLTMALVETAEQMHV